MLTPDTNETSLMTSSPPPHHHHVIPNILIFTHSINLIVHTDKDHTNAIPKQQQQQIRTMTKEDLALQRNVLNSIQYHSNAQVLFWTDDDCFASIGRVMRGMRNNDNKNEDDDGEEKREHDAVLLQQYFRQESHGMYKADICRGAALYEHGGLYMDIDLQVRMSLWDVISEETTFVVPFVHKDSNYPGSFFQAFIGTTQQNPILKQYLYLFLDYYQGKLDLQGPLGVLLLRKAHDQVVGKPKVLWKDKDQQRQHSDTKNKISDTNQTLQYFLEVKYDKRLFPNVPPPNWGTRRACHFVVVSIPLSEEGEEEEQQSRKVPNFMVPFYSRTSGSRMCAAPDVG